ncbi:unnamed protein product, partial [Hapterophycus canaliculatus]
WRGARSRWGVLGGGGRRRRWWRARVVHSAGRPCAFWSTVGSPENDYIPSSREGTYGRGKIHVNGRVCTGCGRPYEQLVDSDATLLAQGPQGADLRVVKLEQKVCNDCSSRGWAGDDIYEDGVFNYNGNVVIELRVLYQLRRAVRAGHPISTWARTFLQPRVDDM